MIIMRIVQCPQVRLVCVVTNAADFKSAVNTKTNTLLLVLVHFRDTNANQRYTGVLLRMKTRFGPKLPVIIFPTQTPKWLHHLSVGWCFYSFTLNKPAHFYLQPDKSVRTRTASFLGYLLLSCTELELDWQLVFNVSFLISMYVCE